MTRPSPEPAIAPLARRLAEENNVDWRALNGSSVGGAVNERDILDYLEAVMLGSKPLDPTPEPLPEGLGAWPEEAERRPELAQLAAQPAVPVKTFEAEYRAALAELKALKAQLADADALKTQLAGLEAERTAWHSDRLELARLRETVQGQKDSLVKAGAFETQVAQLKEALANAQQETRKAQEHGYELAARLNRLNDAQTKAEAEAKQLREAKAALEQTLATTQNRPWWRFWG